MKQAVLLTKITDEQFEQASSRVEDTYDLVRSLDGVEDLDQVEVLISWSSEAQKLVENDELKNVKWVHLTSAGIDKIPLALLKEKDITLTAANGVAAHSIPESIFGALLAYLRDIFGAYDRQRVQYWNKPTTLPQVQNKSMMIIGIGNIGQQLARIAQAFDMNVIGINRSGNKVEHMDVQYTQDEVLDHVDEADIVVNVLPLTDETKDFYDKKFFDRMKDHTIFINVGRGPSVNEDDLLDALNSDKIDYAILDVFKTEPLPADSPFWTHDKVLVMNHQTFAMADYFESTFDIFVENIKEVAEHGKPTINVKNLDAGY